MAKARGRMCTVGAVVRAVDFAQRNGDATGLTVRHRERRGTEVPEHSDIGAP